MKKAVEEIRKEESKKSSLNYNLLDYIEKLFTKLDLNNSKENKTHGITKDACEDYENFEVLLDSYLNLNEIENKIQSDNEEIAKEEKKLAIKKGIDYDNTITIHDFLKNYLHARTNPEFDKMTLPTLKLLGYKSSFVMGVHEKFAKNNPELLDQGFLVLVKDTEHNRAIYINPYFIYKLLEDEEIDLKLKKFSNSKSINLEDIDEYYNEYQKLLGDKEDNEITYNIIKRTRKEKKFVKLKELMEMGDNND